MSYYARNGENSNAAVVVQVGEKDYPAGPLGGLDFRERLEKAAFIAGGADYRAPACTVGALNGKASAFASVKPTYRPGVPVRIPRTETGEATRMAGLYPVGEGAGYAGGIVSAAVDGMKAAEHIMAIYKGV